MRENMTRVEAEIYLYSIAGDLGFRGEKMREAIEVLKRPKTGTGHWIKFVVNRQHKIRCNKCDYVENEYITHIRNYCPNCGAKMEEQEE